MLQPSPDQPELFDWWRPLLAVGRRARAALVPWPIHVDEFHFVGRVARRTRPAVWVYEHRTSGGCVLADWSGTTYSFIPYRRGRQVGRFREVPVRTAVWRAGLPDVVEPVWYRADLVPDPLPPDMPQRPELVVVPGGGPVGRVIAAPPTNLN